MRKRNRSVLIRLTEQELERLDRKVIRTGMSREAYVRAVISDVVPKERPSPELLDVLRELHQIGNNVNQIAARANSTGSIDHELYHEDAEALRQVINKIMGRIFG